MHTLTTLLLLFLCLYSVNLYADVPVKKATIENSNAGYHKEKSSHTLETFLSALQIDQGIANFTQKKHFTFLNTPITSKGVLKIHQGSIIWQVNTPVFSKLIIIDGQVWQRISQGNNESNMHNNTPEQYQVVASHASVETLIRAIFTGEINRTQWNFSLTEQQCLKLSPTELILSQAIKHISVCMPDNHNQRFVTLTDMQGNLTEIELNIITNQLSDEDIREFNLNQ